MANYSRRFADTTISTCGAIANAGSVLLVAPIVGCSEDPLTYTLTVGTAPIVGAEQVELTANVAGVTLRKGAILYFGANKMVVAAQTVVGTTAVLVPCEPLTAVVSGTADTWALLKVQAPTNIPLGTTESMVNNTNLNNGLQGSEFKTKIMLDVQVSVNAIRGDKALFDVIYGASKNTDLVFAFVARTGGLYGWGATLISGFANDGNIEEISRPQFTLKFQAPFSLPNPYEFLDVTEKADLNAILKLAGLPIEA